MSGAVKEVRVFFSWQSDSPSETNSGAIRVAIKKAAAKIQESLPGLKIIPDEATRDTSGSPNIVDKIIEKIDATQIYIADITTVTNRGAARPCANPNVLIELGYAVAQVGWDRIILLFNESIGAFPGDLPFDIARNRVSKYKLESGESAKLSELNGLIHVAIKAVIDKNPKTPSEWRGMTLEKIQHGRDVENLNWLLSQIHVPTLDKHIEDLPRYIYDRSLHFWEGAKSVYRNSLFHIYDPVLKEAIDRLFDAWETTVSFGVRYYPSVTPEVYIFANELDAPLDESQEKDWDEIDNARVPMKQALYDLLSRVRSSYLEVDINKTNGIAWDEYIKFEKEFKNVLGHKRDGSPSDL